MISRLRGLNHNVQVVDRRQSNIKDIPDDILTFTKTLEELLLDSNHIRNLPKGLFRLAKLRKLSLSENDIINLPSAVGNLINLTELDVSKNNIYEIPEEIKLLKELQIADFSCNPLKRLPFSLIHIQSLTDLRLNDVDLTELPSDFGRLINLKSLELRDNSLKSLPSSFVSLGQLKCLDLGNNLFEQMPSCICQLTMLEELWLDCNEISSLSKEIGKLKKLLCLDVTENDLQSLPDEISNLENLTDFYASQNYIQMLPNNFGSLNKLSIIKVDNNKLTYLPANIGNCISVQELMLKENELSELPSSIGKLRNLTTLNVDNNKLLDLPSEICNLSKLSLLSVRDNCLSFLPDNIGKLKELQVLEVSGNRLQYLPASIVSLNLKALWLSENQNQPLLKFQTDFDLKRKKNVITCYLLPQQGYVIEPDFQNRYVEEKNCYNRSVMFEEDSDTETEKTAELIRHGTPHVKELKAKFLKLLPQKLKDIDGQILNADDKEKSLEQFRPQRITNNCVEPFVKENNDENPQEEYNSRVLCHEIINNSPDESDHHSSDKKDLPLVCNKCIITDTLNSSGNENQNMPIIDSDQNNLTNHLNDKAYQQLKELYSPTPNEGNNLTARVLNVLLHRESCGLGLSIAGGKGSTPFKGEDEGIFISRIIDQGPADKAGLKVYDKVLKVNDVPFDNVDHYSAVLTLKNAGDHIKLVILRELNVLRNIENDINLGLSSSKEGTHENSSSQYADMNIAYNVGSPDSTQSTNLEAAKFFSVNHPSVMKISLDSGSPPVTDVRYFNNNSPDINTYELPSSSQGKLPNAENSNTYFHNQLSSFEPEMTSTPLSLSRASSKNIPDLIKPSTLNALVYSAAYDSPDRYEGPVITVTVQNPRPYTPLKPEFPPPLQAPGETTETITTSSYSETTLKRQTNNIFSSAGIIEEVTLTKMGGPLGLSIIGGFDQSCLPFGVGGTGIFVSRIVPNGIIAKTGKIRVGDRLLQVNGVDLRCATHNEAVAALSVPNNQMSLLIQHDPLPSGWCEITINQVPNEVLGVEINGGVHGPCANPFDYEDEGVFISKILPGSAAEKDGRLKVGMRVIEICGISLLGATYEEAIHAIEGVGSTVTFTVCDGFNVGILQNQSYGHVPESGSVTIDSIRCTDSDDDFIDVRNSNQNVVTHEQRTIDEKVLDVVRAAESLVNPSFQTHSSHHFPLKQKKTTTIVMSKHTVNPLTSNQNAKPEPSYLPCEV